MWNGTRDYCAACIFHTHSRCSRIDDVYSKCVELWSLIPEWVYFKLKSVGCCALAVDLNLVQLGFWILTAPNSMHIWVCSIVGVMLHNVSHVMLCTNAVNMHDMRSRHATTSQTTHSSCELRNSEYSQSERERDRVSKWVSCCRLEEISGDLFAPVCIVYRNFGLCHSSDPNFYVVFHTQTLPNIMHSNYYLICVHIFYIK